MQKSLIELVNIAGKKSESFVLLLLAGLFATPFYFASSSEGVVFTPFLAFEKGITETGFGLPVGLVGLVILGGLFVIRFTQRRLEKLSFTSLVAFALIIWLSIAASVGYGSSERPWLTVLLYVQTVIPLLTFVALSILPFDAVSVRKSLLFIPIISAASILLIIGYLGYHLAFLNPIASWAHTQEAFFGVKNIQPVVALTGLCIILAQFSSRDRECSSAWLWSLFIIHAIYITTIWSRTGLLLFGMIFAFWWVGQIYEASKSGKWQRPLIMGVVMVLAAVVSLVVGGISMRSGALKQISEPVVASPRAPLTKSLDGGTSITPRAPSVKSLDGGTSIAPRTPSAKSLDGRANVIPSLRSEKLKSDLKRSDNRRYNLLIGGINRVTERPLIGDAFRPLPSESVIYGVTVKSHKLYPAHNQFVDMGIRAGVPAVALFMALIISLGIALWHRRGPDFNGQLAINSLFLLIALCFGSFFQIYFVVSQSAVIVFLTMALSLRSNCPPRVIKYT